MKPTDERILREQFALARGRPRVGWRNVWPGAVEVCGQVLVLVMPLVTCLLFGLVVVWVTRDARPVWVRGLLHGFALWTAGCLGYAWGATRPGPWR